MSETRLSPVYQFKLAGSDAAGTFRGLASAFGGPPDSYGDVIAPGAFADSLKEHQAAGTVPALLWSHRTAEPVGRWTSIEENRVGLAVEGKLTLATQRGAEAHALMKDDALGLSIGFNVREEAFDKASGANVLKKIKLWEVSLVAIPANSRAQITSVKSAAFMRPDNIREFEAALRDACGFSQREAKRIASAGWPALHRDGGSDELSDIAAMLSAAATDFSQPHR